MWMRGRATESLPITLVHKIFHHSIRTHHLPHTERKEQLAHLNSVIRLLSALDTLILAPVGMALAMRVMCSTSASSAAKSSSLRPQHTCASCLSKLHIWRCIPQVVDQRLVALVHPQQIALANPRPQFPATNDRRNNTSSGL